MNNFFCAVWSIRVIFFAIENLWFHDHSERTFVTFLIMHFQLTMSCCVEMILSWEFQILFKIFLIAQMNATIVFITCCSRQRLMLVFLIFFCCCEKICLVYHRALTCFCTCFEYNLWRNDLAFCMCNMLCSAELFYHKHSSISFKLHLSS